MILSIATSSPPPQLLILTWTTICHYCCRHVPSFCPWPRTWPIVPTRGKSQVVNTWPSIVNSSKVVLSTRGKLSKSVLRIQMIKSHMFGKFRQVHIQDSTVWEHGTWEGEHSCDNKILFTAMLAFTTFLAPHLNIRLFCDNIPRMTWYKITQPPPIRCFNTFILCSTCVLPYSVVTLGTGDWYQDPQLPSLQSQCFL